MSDEPARAVIRKQQQWVAAFRRAQASSPARAKTLSEMGIDAGLAARRLRHRSVLRENPAAALYLDEAMWEALSARRRRVASWLVLGAMLSVIALVFYAGR